MVRDFYVRWLIVLLIQSNSLDYVEKLLQNILSLVTCKYNCYSDLEYNVLAEETRIYLENLISNVSNNYNEKEYKSISSDEKCFCDLDTLTKDFKDQPSIIREYVFKILNTFLQKKFSL